MDKWQPAWTVIIKTQKSNKNATNLYLLLYYDTTVFSQENVLCCHNKSLVLWSMQCENIDWCVRVLFSSYFPSHWLLLSFMSIPDSAIFPLLILIAVLRRSLFPILQGSTETLQPVKIPHLAQIQHLSSIASLQSGLLECLSFSW